MPFVQVFSKLPAASTYSINRVHFWKSKKQLAKRDNSPQLKLVRRSDTVDRPIAYKLDCAKSIADHPGISKRLLRNLDAQESLLSERSGLIPQQKTGVWRWSFEITLGHFVSIQSFSNRVL